MVYDIWMGLQDVCFCSGGGGTTRSGPCAGRNAYNPQCRSSSARPPVIQSDIGGFYICGKRGDTKFLDLVRPRGEEGEVFSCPSGTNPCGNEGQTYLDNKDPENVICSSDENQCPITGLSLVFTTDVDGESDLNVIASKEATNLPVSGFKFSSSQPCININQIPYDTWGQIPQEYTYSPDGCSQNSFLGDFTTNANYIEVTMDGIELLQGDFEQANNVNATLYGHLNANLIPSLGNNYRDYRDLADRNKNVLKLYKKPMIQWKLECESSPDSSERFSRSDAYDALYNKELNRLAPQMFEAMRYGPLGLAILSVIMILMAVTISIQSLCRNCDYIMMLNTCKTNNGSFACSTTAISAGIFFYLLMFIEALDESEKDTESVEKLDGVNACLGPLDQIDINSI